MVGAPPFPPRPPKGGKPDGDPLREADRSERNGDVTGLLAALRRHIDEHPGDRATRLRFARTLIQAGDLAAARRHLAVLERDVGWPDDVARQANRALAEIDEAEGAVTRSALRWERVLADDIDDPQARARLHALRPAPDEAAPIGGDSATLVSPEGLATLRYRLVRELGRGATAAVYLAEDDILGIPLALKVLHPQLAGPGRSDARRRFFAEARLAAALRHPGVIAIYDLDEPTRTLSMEYLAGGTLRTRLRPQTALPPEEIWATARSLLTALGYVHAKGIAHGDLKPSNLLLRAPGAVVLADFGVAQLTTGDGAPAPRRVSEAPGGTPLYLAPEQFHGAPASQATDLYAAGAILGETLTGVPSRSRADLLSATFRPARPSPTTLAPLGPDGGRLGELIAALTDPQPGCRPASAADALSRFPAGQSRS